jgi:hypothetical protein
LQPLLANLKRQGGKVLMALQREIATREKELSELKTTATRWREMVGGQLRMRGAAAPAPARAKRRRRRLDWNAVLAGLPAFFNTKDVQRQTGKPIEQVYAGLSRWVKDKKAKRNSSGSYQKISPAAAPPQKKG